MMKYLAGFIIGVIATISVSLLYFESGSNDDSAGLTMFPKAGACINKQNLKIIQPHEPGVALAYSGEIYRQLVVLLIGPDNKHYYDNQEIRMPANKCAKHIGTYQYKTQDGQYKTVPAVSIK